MKDDNICIEDSWLMRCDARILHLTLVSHTCLSFVILGKKNTKKQNKLRRNSDTTTVYNNRNSVSVRQTTETQTHSRQKVMRNLIDNFV